MRNPVRDQPTQDLLGLRRTHKLRDEFCSGQNTDLTAGPCGHYSGRTCRLMESHDVRGLRESICTWSLLVMAVNAIWDIPNPFKKEVVEAEVLASLERATLRPPTIEALYGLLKKQAWRLALGTRTRKICGNCPHFLPSSRACDRDLRTKLTADAQCSQDSFEPRSEGAAERLCRNCRHSVGLKRCELDSRARINASSRCMKTAFQYVSQEMRDVVEILHDSASRTEAALDTAKILVLLREKYLSACPGTYEKTRYGRFYELVTYLKTEECSVAAAVSHFSEVWGVTDATIRNYMREIRRLLATDALGPRR